MILNSNTDAPGKILICEDEEMVATPLARFLDALGYEVAAIVSTGEEAIEAVDRLMPDMVLMDIGLPGDLDGIETADRIRSDFSIPIVYITGQSELEVLQRAKQTLPYGYLTKPTNREQLKSTIEIALHKHALDRQVQEREELYRLVLSTMTEPVFVTHDDGAFTYISPNCHVLFGYSREEIHDLGTIDRLLGEGFRDPDTLGQNGEIRNIHHRITDKNGLVRDVLIDVKRVSVKEGSILYSFREVTDLWRAEEDLKKTLDELEQRVEARTHELSTTNRELLENKRTIEALLNACTQSIYLVDSQSRVLATNEIFAGRLGTTPEKMVGQDLFRFLPPQVALRRRRFFDDVLQSGEIKRFEDERSGRIVDNTLYPVIDPDGNVSKIAVFATDVTEYRKAEHAIRAQARIIDQIHDSVIATDLDGYVKSWNNGAERMHGYSRQEALGEHISFRDCPKISVAF